MQLIIVFASGLVFGLGLIISGMSNPQNVIQFLDIISLWNPSLLLVMLGAIPVTTLGFYWIEKYHKTAYGSPLHLPGKTHIHAELIIGSIIFGAGWAIAGFCPGPALVALGAGYVKALVFVVAMILGMLLHDQAYLKVKQHFLQQTS